MVAVFTLGLLPRPVTRLYLLLPSVLVTSVVEPLTEVAIPRMGLAEPEPTDCHCLVSLPLIKKLPPVNVSLMLVDAPGR